MSPLLPPRPRNRLPGPDPRLVAAIRDPQLRGSATGIVQYALDAIGDLQLLDESLYERFTQGSGRPTEDAAPDALIARLTTVTFRGLRALLGYWTRIRPKAKAAPVIEDEGDLDFDFGESTDAPAHAPKPGDDEGFELGDADIGDLLEGIDEHEQAGEAERWAALADKLSAIEYGLRSQQQELERRLRTALESGHVAQAIEALDDARSSAGEGIFAMLAAVFETFAPEVDPATVAPGHLSSLGRALLVRRGITDLSRAVGPKNAVVQRSDAPTATREAAFAELARSVSTFVASDVFRAMRPADRFELAQFDRQLAAGTVRDAALVAEGLSKYLESLGSINRREVLIQHDQRALEELRDALSAARPLLEINAKVAGELVGKAWAAAVSLYGKNAANDDLLAVLRDTQPSLATAAEIEASLGTLELLLADEPA